MSHMQAKVIASGKGFILRDRTPSDADCHLRWHAQGEWRSYDAPWEIAGLPKTDTEKERFRQSFLKKCNQEPETPRKFATIASKSGMPLGWVVCYMNDRFPQTRSVGISICEDKYLNKGIGTEALRLWIRYLFTHSDVHRIGLDTWSLNPRMVHVAEKLGFTSEGAQREMIEWQGQWHDLIHYGMLRGEWEEMERR